MTGPVAAASMPPRDLDGRYKPYEPFAQWQRQVVDLALVDAAAALLEHECRAADPATVREAIDVAVRAAAFDTGAVEGLYETDRGVTFAVATQAAAWESVVAEASGREAVRHFEAQLRAFELVLDAATGGTAISAAWLRALQDITCAGQPTYRALTTVGWQDVPLPRGEYRRLPNHVRQPDGSWHSYAPVDQVGPEVQRLIDEIGSEAFGQAHPVVQAAYVHHALVYIHPFADGNGRVARAVASVFLYRALRVPFLLFVDERLRYLSAVRAADHGDHAAYLRFVRDLTIDTIELVLQTLQAARSAGAVAALAALSGGDAEPAPDHRQVSFLAARLRTAVHDELREVVAQLPDGLMSLEIAPGRPADGQGPLAMKVVATSPRRAEAGSVESAVVVAPEPAAAWPLRVVAEKPDHRQVVAPMRVRLGNVYPALTTVTRQRLREWARQLVHALAAELAGLRQS